MGKLVFLDLVDRSGRIQLLCPLERTGALDVHLGDVVGARNVDLTLELAFFEEWSTRERRAMDTDGNGRITPTEVEAYVKKIAPGLAGQVTLRLAGRVRPLVPLYDQAVDLVGKDRAIPWHHVLRLYYFAPTPADLSANDEFLVEDRLWSQAEALVTVTAGGKDAAAVDRDLAARLARIELSHRAPADGTGALRGAGTNSDTPTPTERKPETPQRSNHRPSRKGAPHQGTLFDHVASDPPEDDPRCISETEALEAGEPGEASQ